MGSAQWGHGYHKGYADGKKAGGAIGATISGGIVTVLAGAALAVLDKVKTKQAKKREQELLAELCAKPELQATGDSDDPMIKPTILMEGGENRMNRDELKSQIDELMRQYADEEIDGATYAQKMMELTTSHQNESQAED